MKGGRDHGRTPPEKSPKWNEKNHDLRIRDQNTTKSTTTNPISGSHSKNRGGRREGRWSRSRTDPPRLTGDAREAWNQLLGETGQSILSRQPCCSSGNCGAVGGGGGWWNCTGDAEDKPAGLQRLPNLLPISISQRLLSSFSFSLSHFHLSSRRKCSFSLLACEKGMMVGERDVGERGTIQRWVDSGYAL
jgi:hypothetical protein